MNLPIVSSNIVPSNVISETVISETLTYEQLEEFLQVHIISIGIVIGFLMVLCIAKGWDSNGI